MAKYRLLSANSLRLFTLSAAISIASCIGVHATATHTFGIKDGSFVLDDKPYLIRAAELHYPRIPAPYWEHRIEMCKALGMNTICLYVFWNVHEQQPDHFDFTGQNDLRHFIELCALHEMNVILRPGPYVCAEWEMGGLPWWLLREHDIKLRERDPYFMERVDKFQQAVADQVCDLTVDNGGPIIMIQVENEYGSYGIDKEYVSDIRDILRKYFGDQVTLFQCDWSSNFTDNGLDDLLWTMNFGTGADIEQQFARLKELRPDTPLMCSEYWSGWFDKWGANHETRPATEMISGIEQMLSGGISFSLYMTHGGTNWGHWAGANSPGYAPDVTSYDYDAPISEGGAPTPKYYALREAMQRYLSYQQLPDIPATPGSISVSEFELNEVSPLWNNLGTPVYDENIKPMEDYGVGYGSILYRTSLPILREPTELLINEAHDFAQIFVDGEYIGSLDRRLGENTMTIPACDEGAQLDILVEAMGRINFGRAIKDYKGITDSVRLRDAEHQTALTGWQVYTLPDTPAFYEAAQYQPLEEIDCESRRPRGIYRGVFQVYIPGDTYLNFENWGKGLVYVNGHPLGRIWEIGPQQTLYMPGCWLTEGENEIVIFDIVGPRSNKVWGETEPVLDKLQEFGSNISEALEIDRDLLSLVLSAECTEGNGWQQHQLPGVVAARYICIEPVSAFAGDDVAIAELYLLDENAQRIDRNNWRVISVDSQDKKANHTADKMFDLQESTYWSSLPGSVLPHSVIIDLGREHNISAIQHLPRMETGAPGAIAKYNVYIGR